MDTRALQLTDQEQVSYVLVHAALDISQMSELRTCDRPDP
jgi:hypothetical protein